MGDRETFETIMIEATGWDLIERHPADGERYRSIETDLCWRVFKATLDYYRPQPTEADMQWADEKIAEWEALPPCPCCEGTGKILEET